MLDHLVNLVHLHWKHGQTDLAIQLELVPVYRCRTVGRSLKRSLELGLSKRVAALRQISRLRVIFGVFADLEFLSCSDALVDLCVQARG